MREMKYRFYYKGQRIEDNLTLTEIGGRCEFHWAHDVDIVEYTGLKDKNGVEIYEGDVLKFAAADGAWSNGVAVVFRHGMFSTVAGSVWGLCVREGLVEVIGNIWENPELIRD
ncbi:hypothetical protein LCGC14_2397800 [marine sediment metagenome]|uniref:YopX protein domain-containing protein n=1 Tax=marine sediment metagenome TaxID=412755 RepID=A0A0F9BWD4_9ZZZZ